MGRTWYLIWTAVGLLAGLAGAWYVEPSTAAGSGILVSAGVLAGLAAGWFAAAFVPLRPESYAWTGISGRSYDYVVCEPYTRFSDHQACPGNFVFVKMMDDVCWPLFFGETPDAVRQKPQLHVTWDEAVTQGVTHIHWHNNSNEAARLAEVDDLVVKHAPPLNRPAWDHARAEKLRGATVLVGYFNDPAGQPLEQFYGTVMSTDPREGITLRLEGSRSGELYTLPPDLRAFYPARPGSYRLRDTGDVVLDPDYMTTWDVRSAPP